MPNYPKNAAPVTRNLWIIPDLQKSYPVECPDCET